MGTSTAERSVASPPAPSVRLRGTVLCYFHDTGASDIETALTRAGMTLLRARSSVHAISLARTAYPDVILTDITDPAESAQSFLSELQRTRSCRAIPVVAFVSAQPQSAVHAACLRFATLALLRDTPTAVVVSEIGQLITTQDRMIRIDDATTASVDAFFSELGSRKRRRRQRADENRRTADESGPSVVDRAFRHSRLSHRERAPHELGKPSAIS